VFIILVCEHHHLWLKGSMFYSLPRFVLYLKHQWLSISTASKPNTMHVWVLNFQVQIKKNILDLDVHCPLSNFENFQITAFALHVRVWGQKQLVSYLHKEKMSFLIFIAFHVFVVRARN
jgi:hypothetical protein